MGIICYSLIHASYSYCDYMAASMKGAAVEIRLDKCDLTDEEIHALFSRERDSLLLATCHSEKPSEEEEAARKLSAAIIAGADYVDIPLASPEPSRKWLMNLALNHGCKVIMSYHDHVDTDDTEALLSKARQALCEGADIIKIVTTATCREDISRVMSLYGHFERGRLEAFCMGPLGRRSRFDALEKGAPLLFVAPTRSGVSAPGQPTWFDLLSEEEILLRGEAPLPASKSCAQRAILLAALTTGTTKLYDLTLCDDTRAAIRVAEQLYAEVSYRGTQLTIKGCQDIPARGLQVRDNTLNVGESALLARLCIPLAGLSPENISIVGEKTLLNRRIDDHRGALRELGLKVEYSRRHYLPAVVKGRLRAGDVELEGDKGSQMISGLLLALSQCEGESSLRISEVTSEPYINLTSYIASFFGLNGYECPEIDEPPEDPDQEDDFYRTWYIDGGQTIKPVVGLQVERDWSAAAMLLAAGAVAGDVTVEGLDMLSCQADALICDALTENHADIVIDEQKGRVSVRRSQMTPFFFDILDAPDLFAPLFVLAVFTEGQSTIAGISRLRNKESDRAATFAEEFGKLGVQTEIYNDEITVFGHSEPALRGARCSSHGDHRLAMALKVASLRVNGSVTIDDTDCIAKSFPGFLETLSKLNKKD